MIIGLEGPAGSGKTTMAHTVAAEIGAVVMEGGIWYRALTYLALKRGIEASDTGELKAMAATLDVQVNLNEGGDHRIHLGDEDVTEKLYHGEVSGMVGLISGQHEVRVVLETRIAAWAQAQPSVIMVGRNLKRALPDAEVLRLVIDEVEAERRHAARAAVVTHTVAERNALDRATAHLLGTDNDGVCELDVTHLTPGEQAEALRRFIADLNSD